MMVELQTVNTAKTLDVINHSKWKEALKKQQQDTFILKCIEMKSLFSIAI